MRLIIGIVFVLMCFFDAYSQEVKKETVEGKVYIIHIVEAGNTLFGLQRKYAVQVDDILQANPTASDGLQIGQRILIPTNEAVTSAVSNEVAKTHTVQAGETLFGISRTYSCSVDELLRLNPAAETGLDIGQELVLPARASINEAVQSIENAQEVSLESKDSVIYDIKYDDSIVKYTVQQGETLYSISRRFMVDVDVLTQVNDIRRNKISPGDQLIIPLKKERITEVFIKPIRKPRDTIAQTMIFAPKEKYSIVVLLPFKIQSNRAIVSGIIDDDSRLNNVSEIALDFYMGVELALDSLKSLSLVAEVTVFDTEGSETTTKALLDNDKVKKADIIIGPIFPKNIMLVADWSSINKKRIILPASVSTSTLKDNPYAYATVPSDITLIQGMASFLAQNHWDDNLVIVQTGQNDEKERMEIFMAEYNRNLPKGVTGLPVKKAVPGSSSGRDLARTFMLDTLNVFVNLTDNVQSVMKFINTLNAARNSSTRHGKANVIAVGTRAWLNIEPLNSYYKNRYKLHVANTTKVDESTAEFLNFQRQYRAKFNTDGSRYSIQGYDVTLNQLASLLLNKELNSGVMNNFQMEQVGEGQGWENKSVFIVKQDEFELRLIDVVNSSSTNFKDEE